MSFHEIKERYASCTLAGKTLSQDSLWLYINTLKGLGCEISRPTRSNGFCYKLTYHPFSHFLTGQDVQLLKDTLNHIDERLDYWDVVHFHRWLERMFCSASNANRHELLQQFMKDIRVLNFDAFEALILELERYCQAPQLLRITYQSPIKGLKTIEFLPQKIFHHQGVLYLLGQSADWSRASMLRLDRIEQVVPFEDPALFESLLQKQLEKQVFVLRILNNVPHPEIELLGENEQIVVDPTDAKNLLVWFRTDNEFLLIQKLLALGCPFQVVYPRSFMQELQRILGEMRQVYAS